MNDNKNMVDIMSEINPEFLDEYYDRRKARLKRRKNMLKYCSVAASVAVVVTVSSFAIAPMLRDESAVAPSNDETNVFVENTEQGGLDHPNPTVDNIFFVEDITGNNGRIDQGFTEGENLYDFEKTLVFSTLLKNFLETSDDDDVFAFTVSVINGDPADVSLEATEAVGNAYSKLTLTAEECISEMMAEKGISRAEAIARKYTNPKYISAKNEYLKAEEKYRSESAISFYNNNKEALELLSGVGFTLLYDGTDSEYQMYLHAMNSIGVMTATKAQLLEISEAELEYRYIISAASKEADEYLPSSLYGYADNALADDSKITNKLVEAYELNGGEALEVRCIIAYFGKEYIEKWELDQAALAAIGMTEAEFNASNDPTVFDRYREAKKNIREHTEYNDSIVKSLLDNGYLKNSEFIGKEYNEGGFKAFLTYERALELSEHGNIAYIEIDNQYVDNDLLPAYSEDLLIVVPD